MRTSFYIVPLILLMLAACGPEEDISPTEEPAQTQIPIVAETPIVNEAPTEDTSITKEKRPIYCNQIVAQIQAETKSIGTCKAGGHGHRTKERNDYGKLWPERNEAAIVIHGPAIKALGFRSLSFNVNRGVGKSPKFTAGVYEMDQARLKDNPNNQVISTDDQGGVNYMTLTSSDADALKSKIAPSQLEGVYEITSAVLRIDFAEDIREEDMGPAIDGDQYVRGSLSFSLVPLGPKGDSFSGTFEFGTEVNWGIFND